MKKTACYTLLAILALILAGCTLSMEEWEVTEERKGYDEPVTVKNEFMTFTYQYKPTTRSLTDTIQSYIVHVEDDSILYFLDNTPEEWLPKVGGQVVANCSRKFPTGLMRHVNSVEKEGGFIKVVTSDANLEDIYEKFNFDFDADIKTSRISVEDPVYDDEDEDNFVNWDNEQGDSLLNSRACRRSAHVEERVQERFTRTAENGEKEIAIRDWTMFNAMEKSQNKTRGDDKWDEDMDKEDEQTNVRDIINITPGDELSKKMLSKLKVINTFQGSFSQMSRDHIHKIIELDRKREFTETTQTMGAKLHFMIGLDCGSDILDDWKDDRHDKMAEKVRKWKETPGKFPKFKEKVAMDKKWGSGVVVEIPLWASPICAIIRLKPVCDVTLGFFGDFEYEWWITSKRITTDVINGETIVDKEETLSAPKNQYAINLFGNFGLSFGGEFFLGMGKKSLKKPWGVGGFFKPTLDMSVNLDWTVAGNYTLGSGNDALSISGNAEWGGMALTGGLFGDVKFARFSGTLWDGYTYNFYPKPTMREMPVKYKEIYYDYKNAYHYVYTLKCKFGPALFFKEGNDGSEDVPLIYVFKNREAFEKKQKFLDIVEDTESGKNGVSVLANREYTFEFVNDEKNDYYVVPGLEKHWPFKTEFIVFKEGGMRLRGESLPVFRYECSYDGTKNEYLYQTRADYNKESDIYNYEYEFPFELYNASEINKNFDDWGVYFRAVSRGNWLNPFKPDPNAFDKEMMVSLKNKVTKSGKYVVKTSWYTPLNADKNYMYIVGYIYFRIKNSGFEQYIGREENQRFSYDKYYIFDSEKGDTPLKLEHEVKTKAERKMEKSYKSKGYKVISTIKLDK